MSILQFVIDHWSQIGLAVSESLGLFGLGGFAKQLAEMLWKKKPAA